MKRRDFLLGMVYIIAGILFLFSGVKLRGEAGSLFVGFGGALIGAGVMIIGKYIYWTRPQNRERYQEKLYQESIDAHDELKEKLRNQSGRYAYAIGLIVIAVSIMIFACLRAFGVIEEVRIITLYLGGYLIFQIVIGIVLFRHLLKKYE